MHICTYKTDTHAYTHFKFPKQTQTYLDEKRTRNREAFEAILLLRPLSLESHSEGVINTLQAVERVNIPNMPHKYSKNALTHN